jgi:hypothetical protein
LSDDGCQQKADADEGFLRVASGHQRPGRSEPEAECEDDQRDTEDPLRGSLDARRPMRVMGLYAESSDQHDRGERVDPGVSAEAEQRQLPPTSAA